MKTIAVVNQKGGVGKTTCTFHIGQGLILKGYKVLFVDLESQRNLTFTMSADPTGKTIIDLLQESIDAEPGAALHTLDAIQHTPQGDIIASAAQIAAADTILADVPGREHKLKEILEPVKGMYDYCIIDTSPQLGTLTVNALTAAQAAIAPTLAEAYSIISIGQLYETIETVKRYSNPGLTFSGIVITRYDGKATVRRELAEEIEAAAAQYGTQVYKTKIRECAAVQEAALTRQSVFKCSRRSNAAKDYAALVEEIIEQE